MAARKKKTRKTTKKVSRKKSSSPKKTKKLVPDDLHIPGALLIAFGLMLLPANYDLIPGLEPLKAWPLLFVLFGFVLFAKSTLSKKGR